MSKRSNPPITISQMAIYLKKKVPGFAYANYGVNSMKKVLALPELARVVFYFYLSRILYPFCLPNVVFLLDHQCFVKKHDVFLIGQRPPTPPPPAVAPAAVSGIYRLKTESLSF